MAAIAAMLQRWQNMSDDDWSRLAHDQRHEELAEYAEVCRQQEGTHGSQESEQSVRDLWAKMTFLRRHYQQDGEEQVARTMDTLQRDGQQPTMKELGQFRKQFVSIRGWGDKWRPAWAGPQDLVAGPDFSSTPITPSAVAVPRVGSPLPLTVFDPSFLNEEERQQQAAVQQASATTGAAAKPKKSKSKQKQPLAENSIPTAGDPSRDKPVDIVDLTLPRDADGLYTQATAGALAVVKQIKACKTCKWQPNSPGYMEELKQVPQRSKLAEIRDHFREDGHLRIGSQLKKFTIEALDIKPALWTYLLGSTPNQQSEAHKNDPLNFTSKSGVLKQRKDSKHVSTHGLSVRGGSPGCEDREYRYRGITGIISKEQSYTLCVRDI